MRLETELTLRGSFAGFVLGLGFGAVLLSWRKFATMSSCICMASHTCETGQRVIKERWNGNGMLTLVMIAANLVKGADER